MADEKLNTGPAENISPEAAGPITTPEQAAASEPQQEQTGPAIPEPGDVVVSFDKINELMLMEANAARVIKAVTNTPLDIPEDAEVIDVCKAVEDMMNESKTEGAVAVLAGLVKDGLLSIKEAAHRANMTESAFEAEVKKLS